MVVMSPPWVPGVSSVLLCALWRECDAVPPVSLTSESGKQVSVLPWPEWFLNFLVVRGWQVQLLVVAAAGSKHLQPCLILPWCCWRRL